MPSPAGRVNHHIRHLLSRQPPSPLDPRLHLRSRPPIQMRQQLRLHKPGLHIRNPHILRPQLHPQVRRQVRNSSLRSAINRIIRKDGMRRHRRDVHQIGNTTLRSRSDQIRRELPDHPQRPRHVQIHHPRPIPRPHLRDRRRQHHPGVVHHQVHPPERLPHSRTTSRDRLRRRDIHLHRQSGPATSLDLPRQLPQPIPPPREQRHPRPTSGQRQSRSRPDPAGRPGHHSDPINQNSSISHAHNADVKRVPPGGPPFGSTPRTTHNPHRRGRLST